jgi:ABC-type dipeptide/oligopeptide/nickel transport system ATPase subunit
MGEQKLIAFGRALVCRPTLLFLDEWIESLDDNAANRLITLVKQHKRKNNTGVFVSHNKRVIQNLADYVVVLVGGNVNMQITHEQIDSDQEYSDLLEKIIT